MAAAMKFNVLTLFPEITDAFFSSSIMGKAVEKGLIEYNPVNIRDFADDKHRSCDDAPYGGGAGMVLMPVPLGAALDSVGTSEGRIIYTSPSGRLLTQRYAAELAAEEELTIICGRYEGIDQRIIDEYVDDEISVGDYVLSSGETAALVIIDAVYRLLDGVISADSLDEESFGDGLLEYPHYTRPSMFHGMNVPEILLSGHHANIEKWRLMKRVEKTMKYRPDLLDFSLMTEDVKDAAEKVKENKERGKS